MSEEQKRTGLYVPVQTYTENLGGRDPEDRWTADSYRHSNHLSGRAYLAPEKDDSSYGYRHPGDLIVVGGDVKVGDTIYVLWAEYSTGDTFHREDGCYEMIAGFLSSELAFENSQRARDHKLDDRYSGWTMNIRLDDGAEFSYHIPWLGYFERLERINVDSVLVQPA